MRRPLPTNKWPKTRWKKECDILFSQIIRTAGICCHCGKTVNLQCAHIISRGYLATRFDLGNAVCLCSGDHVWFTNNPLEWEQWVIKRIGPIVFAALKAKALSHQKPDYPEVYRRLGGTIE